MVDRRELAGLRDLDDLGPVHRVTVIVMGVIAVPGRSRDVPDVSQQLGAGLRDRRCGGDRRCRSDRRAGCGRGWRGATKEERDRERQQDRAHAPTISSDDISSSDITPTWREPRPLRGRRAPMLQPLRDLALGVVLGLTVIGCSPAAIASVLPVPSGPLVTVTTRGGECVNGRAARRS